MHRKHHPLSLWLAGAAFALAFVLAGTTALGWTGGWPLRATDMQASILPVLPEQDTVVQADMDAAIQRPVFHPGRRPLPYVLALSTEAGDVEDLRLSGVVMTPQLSLATLTTADGQSLRLRLGGQTVGGWQLQALSERQAVVSGPSGTRVLVLRGEERNSETDSNIGNPQVTSISGGSAQVPIIPDDTSASTPAPSNEQMKLIRERIEARRRQITQAQQAGKTTEAKQ